MKYIQEKNIRLIGLLFGVIGFTLLAMTTSWLAAIAVGLLIWGNNASQYIDYDKFK